MRILRLYAPMLKGEHTLCWVSNGAEGGSCINGVETVLRLARAGDAINESGRCEMTIVLPRQAKLKNGYFLSLDDCGTLLRWNETARYFEVVSAGFFSVSAKVSVWSPLRTAVLTVSDKCSRGERKDTSGPALAALAGGLGCEVTDRKIVSDDITSITDTVSMWSDEGYNLVLITGGTGLSQRDVTPEALLRIAEKTVPGFGEVMRLQTIKYTERAFLTRSLAVIKGKTLIISFPGSERAVRQCFDAVSGALRHGVETLAGIDGECGEHVGHGR